MSQENLEVVRRLWAALNEDPPRVLVDLFDEEAEIRNPPEFPIRGPFRGHEGVRVWAREVWEVFAEVHHEVDEVIDLGDTVVSVQHSQGRTRHMEIDTDWQWAAIFTLGQGKILRAQGYMSKAEALEATGLADSA